MTARRDYGSGSVYQRKDGRWVGALSDNWTERGTRKRIVVTAKTRPEVVRKLNDKRRAIERGEVGASPRETVKGWADKYLAMRVRDLRPKAYNAYASPIRKWIVPTIGGKRLADLTPADVRAVHDACRDADRNPADVHRALHTMLQTAVKEGHVVAPRILAIKAPASAPSDRAAMTVDEGLAVLREAAEMPNGSRWLFNVLYGARLGECAGLTWDAVDLDAAEAIIEWQLQALPYNRHRDRSSGFRVPDGHEARHLVDAYHLTRPKSRAGYRVAPFLPAVNAAMLKWREVGPDSPHGLVWPEANGRPRNDKHDRAEWWALQERAGVAHPTRLRKDNATGEMVPAPYHMHETRNFAATMLLEADVPEHVVADLLGHSTVAVSLRYRTRRRGPLREAMEHVGERLQLG